MTVKRAEDKPVETRDVLFFTSYCGGESNGCSNKKPCISCLGMSNVFRVTLTGDEKYLRELAPEWLHTLPSFDPELLRLTAEQNNKGLNKVRRGFYKHFKGHIYFVSGMTTHSETLEPLVLYKRCGLKKSWSRPLHEWHKPLPDGSPRFKFLGTKLSVGGAQSK